jgi:hypothetical protein
MQGRDIVEDASTLEIKGRQGYHRVVLEGK